MKTYEIMYGMSNLRKQTFIADSSNDIFPENKDFKSTSSKKVGMKLVLW